MVLSIHLDCAYSFGCGFVNELGSQSSELVSFNESNPMTGPLTQKELRMLAALDWILLPLLLALAGDNSQGSPCRKPATGHTHTQTNERTLWNRLLS